MQKSNEAVAWENTASYQGYDKEALNSVISYCSKFGTVLEVGCGSGSWSYFIRKNAFNVIGVDFSPTLIKKFNKDLKNCDGIRADAEYLPIKKGSINQVFFTFSLHHIINQRICLEWAANTVGKQGKIVLIEPNGSNFVRYLCYKIGCLMKSVGINVSSPEEKPVNAYQIVKTLQSMGFKCELIPCYATINHAKMLSSFTVKAYSLSLRVASKVFPSVFGSSDFILVAEKISND